MAQFSSAAKGAIKYPKMFTPLNLKNGVVLKNRVIMGSMHTGLEEAHGGKLTQMADFYAARAKGGCGLIVTGGIAPNREGWVAPFAAKLTNDKEAQMHKEVTEAVHAHDGAKIAMQILHSGRYGYHPLNVAPSAIKAPIGMFTPRALSHDGIMTTIDDFARCANLASQAGYDGVEIMGSEGYLINQFIATRTNKRDDEWGGAYENRIKLALEIVKRCRAEVNPDFMLIFRLSMLDLVEGGSTWEEVVILARELEKAGVDIINTGIGWHEARVPTIATSVPRGAFTWVTKKMKEEGGLSIPLCSTNRMNGPQVVEEALASGSCDLVSMARPFLADADIINKSEAGREKSINTCIGCNQACLDHTFKMMTASCLVNPVAGYEGELGTQVETRVSQPLRVAVVGAGPAGLAAACTASERGHSVTLMDSASEIGGQFNLAKQVPGKEEFYETIRYFNNRLEECGVEVKLGTRVSAADLVGKYDKVVLATGIKPRKLTIPGNDHPKVIPYESLLSGKVKLSPSSNVAIIGAGGIGFDVASFLLHGDVPQGNNEGEEAIQRFMQEWGVDMKHEVRGGLVNKAEGHTKARDIYLLQRTKGKPGAGLGKTTGWIHRATLAKGGVNMMGGIQEYVKVDDEGLHIKIKDKVQVLKVDHVIVCAGQDPLKELLEPLKAGGVSTFLIGGAEAATELDAKRAIDQGTRLSAVIESAKDGEVFNQPVAFQAEIVKTVRKLTGKNFA